MYWIKQKRALCKPQNLQGKGQRIGLEDLPVQNNVLTVGAAQVECPRPPLRGTTWAPLVLATECQKPTLCPKPLPQNRFCAAPASSCSLLEAKSVMGV